jgi:8-oxo-dGTP pyrophosphatase MutT (NUDIX family)
MATAHPTPHRDLPSALELAKRIGALLQAVPLDPPIDHRRLAAVLILLYEHEDVPHVVLTKRTDTLEHHPGQVSLPGGRWEMSDGDLGTTALRETHEELGIPPESVRLIGRLSDELTAVSGFVVAPFVGVSSVAIQPVPSEHEIARVLQIPLAELLAADDALPTSLDIISLRYPLLGEDVWGATARILHMFSGVVRAALREPVPVDSRRGNRQ